MAVIADLASYPEWSDGVKSVEILTEFEDGRPGDAHFVLDAGAIKDSYTLEYDWDADRSVTWRLTEGHMLKAMDGVYQLTDNGDGIDHGRLPARGRREHPDDRPDPAQGREGHRRHRAARPQGARRGLSRSPAVAPARTRWRGPGPAR